MKQYYFKALFLSIVLISLLLRLFLLGGIPAGLTNDEADIGYDAYSLLLTGKDQWGQFLPFTAFKGFGDYRLPIYTYFVIPFIKLFGLSEFAVRLPSAISGSISVILIFFVATKLFEREKFRKPIGVITMILMGVSPWAVGLSRIGIESNIAIALFLMGFLLFLYSKGRPYIFLSSMILFASTIYTYTSYALFTPLTVVILLLSRRNDLKISTKKIVICVFIFLLCILPIFVFRSATGVRVSQISFMNSQDNVGILADLNNRRGSCDEVLPVLGCKIFQNKPVIFVNTFVQNYLNHFSFNFLFLNGTTTQYSILPPRSLFYSFELIFLLSGIMIIFVKKIKSAYILVVLLLISPLPDSITGIGHFSRASNMLPFLFLIEGLGAGYLYMRLKSYQQVGKILAFLLLIVCSYSVLVFLSVYFTYFPKHYSLYSQYGYKDLIGKISEKQKIYNSIYVSKFSNDTKQYIYQLFYQKYDPLKFQDKPATSYTYSSDGWVSVNRVENIYYTEKIPSELELNKIKGSVLLVSHPTEFPHDIEILDRVRIKNGDTQFVFVDKDTLLNYYKNHSKLTN